MALSDGLINYFNFDINTEDAITADVCTSDIPPTHTTGKFNNGYQFNGINEYLEFDNNIDLSNNFTINFWAIIDTSSSLDEAVISQHDGTTANWIVAPYSNYLRFSFFDGATIRGFDGGADSVFLGAMKMYSISYDATVPELKFYLDGVLKRTVSTLTYYVSNNPSARVKIGTTNRNANAYFDGVLDDLAIWNRVLTDTEISELYNGGTGQIPMVVSSYSISGVVKIEGTPTENVDVYLINETKNTLDAQTTSASDGTYSFNLLNRLTKFHVIAKYDTGTTKYSVYSKPYITPVEDI